MRRIRLPPRSLIPKLFSLSTLKLFSPAKINLYLQVIRRRVDGYHDIDTLFERISLTDEITLISSPEMITLAADRNKVPTGPDNLVWRAASLLKETYGVRKGVRIILKKRIPVAAGLGGGSSNAATVLMGLNRFWKLRLSQKKLLILGAKLGSDVPFFILNTSFAHGTGRGEVLEKIPAKTVKIWHCLVKPDFGISTKEAYQGLKCRLFATRSANSKDDKPAAAGLTPPGADAKMLAHSIKKGDIRRLSGLLKNSLEVTLNNKVRIISKIKKELVRQGALASLMSGSGSTVFGIFSSRSAAVQAAGVMRKKNGSWQVFVVSTY